MTFFDSRSFLSSLPSSPVRALWDIETGPEPEEVIRSYYEPMGDFSVEKCKEDYATARDPKKGDEFIAKKKEEHEQAQKKHWENFRDRAALSPLTGNVLAIGIRAGGNVLFLHGAGPDAEKRILAEFLEVFDFIARNAGSLVGFNINRFDLSFVFRRALRYRLPVHALRGVRFWHGAFVDLLAVWGMNDPRDTISLDTLCRFLGLTRKNGDGAHFFQTYAEDIEAALDYLGNDLTMTHEAADLLLGCESPEEPVILDDSHPDLEPVAIDDLTRA